VAEIQWSRAAERAYFRLPVRARAEFSRVIRQLGSFPELAELVTEGRFRGCRRAVILPNWVLYYRVVGRERRCVLVAIRDARRRPV